MARFLHLCPSGRAAPGSGNVKASSSSGKAKANGNGKAKAAGGGGGGSGGGSMAKGGGSMAKGGGSSSGVAKAGYVLSSKEFEDMVSSQLSKPDRDPGPVPEPEPWPEPWPEPRPSPHPGPGPTQISSRLSRLATAPGLHHVFSYANFLTFKPEDQAKLLALLPEQDRHNPEACLRSEQLVSAVRSRT